MEMMRDKFMERVVVVPYDRGCWLWSGKMNAAGRPVLTIEGTTRIAARLSLCLFKTFPKTPELFALHTCDNALCVNPDHLYWGTRADNGRDMSKRGRVKWDAHVIGLKGEQNPGSRLRNVDVIEIRRLHWEDHVSYSEIGRRYKLNSGRVHNICHGIRWGHVKEGLPNPKQTLPPTTNSQFLQCIAVLSILRRAMIEALPSIIR